MGYNALKSHLHNLLRVPRAEGHVHGFAFLRRPRPLGVVALDANHLVGVWVHQTPMAAWQDSLKPKMHKLVAVKARAFVVLLIVLKGGRGCGVYDVITASS